MVVFYRTPEISDDNQGCWPWQAINDNDREYGDNDREGGDKDASGTHDYEPVSLRASQL